ncbi:MAG: hypothetical protein GY749_39195 [Desulfobacteraceae bacterium]|nr:hypothetical protein [Desulfobacteraceae bacterium]
MLELTPLEQTTAGKELIQIGWDEGKKETAANLLKLGMDLKIISQATGLSEKEIKKLALRK